MKVELKHKIICLLLAGLIGTSNTITTLAGTVYHKDQKLTITNQNCREPIMKSNGYVDYDNFAPAQVNWTNPVTKQVYQAYCKKKTDL